MEEKIHQNHYGALYPVYPSYVYTGDNCTVYLETGSCLPYTLELWGERTFQDRGVHSTDRGVHSTVQYSTFKP